MLFLADEHWHEVAGAMQVENINYGEFVKRLGPRGPVIITFVFSIIFLSPVPLPGLSVIIGPLIMLGGLSMALGTSLKLPKWVAQKPLPRKIALYLTAENKWFKKINFLLRSRLQIVTDKPGGVLISGLIVALCGFFLSLPLPPGTNLPPAVVCSLISLGLMKKDGLVVLLGWLLFIVEVIVFSQLFSVILKMLANYF